MLHTFVAHGQDKPGILTRVAIFLLLMCMSPAAVSQDVDVRIRLINGKNGKPITDENLNIFRNGSGFAENAKPDRNGVITLRIERSAVFGVGSNIQVTCHPYKPNEKEVRTYSVGKVLSDGIVDLNTCSKKVKATAQPGEFIFFERPRTFWEWMWI
jgi:hypothetical protein